MKVTVFEGRARIETSMKFEDLRKVEAVFPEALVLKNSEGPIFRVATGEVSAATDNGVIFTEDMKIIVDINPEVDVQEAIGKLLYRLQEVADRVEEAAKQIDTDLSKVIKEIK